MPRPTHFLIFALSLFSLVVSLLAEEPAHPQFLKVGTAVVDSSPTQFPCVMNGGFIAWYSSKVNDPLHIRAIVIDDGETQIAMATADACVIPGALIEWAKDQIVKQVPLRKDRIMVSSTHCHSCPSLMPLLGTPVDEHYPALFREKLVEAVVAAYQNRQDARVAWGKDFDPENVYCRRFIMKEGTAVTVDPDFTGSKGDIAQMNPGNSQENIICRTGIPNPTVYVVAFQSPDGKPLALMANYSTHYAGAKEISADYFGLFCSEMAKRLGGDENFFAVMTNGTSGDCNCIDFYSRTRQFTMETVANSVADAAERACKRMQFTDWVPVKMTEEKLTVGVRKGTPAQVEKAKKYLADLEAEGKTPRTMTDVYALGTVLMDSWPDERDLTLQAIRIGDVGITILPNETYSATGHKIRAASKAPMTYTIALANDYAGYLPTEADFELGGYTTWRTMSSCCEPKAEEKIRTKLIEMVNSLFE